MIGDWRLGIRIWDWDWGMDLNEGWDGIGDRDWRMGIGEWD